MVNSATGDAASASMRTTTSGGPDSWIPATENSAPAAIDQGSGLLKAPRSARASAARVPWPAASCICASAMHSEVVMNRSARMVQIIGPAAAGPSSATSSGTPMKPVFGNEATSAPKAESLRCTRSLEREGDGREHHQQRTQHVHQQQRRVQQLEQRGVHAEAKQHARQREVQHEGVQPGDRAVGQHAALRRQPATQHEREERYGDGENGLHAGQEYLKARRRACHSA